MKVRARAVSLTDYKLVVVDTNVILSAALVPKSVPAEFLDPLLRVGSLVFAEATFAELETRFWKPKFDRYVSIERRKQLLGDLSASARWIDLPETSQAARFSREADDDKCIHVALACGATPLVTGDEDLLVLGAVGETKIISPRVALNEISRVA